MQVRGGAAGAARLGGRLVVAAFAAALVALAAAPAPARAGGDPGVRLGYYAGADADEAVPTVGLYGRLDVPGPLNLELSADYRRERLLGGDIEATLVPLRVTAVLSLAPVVSPYLAAGAGLDFVRFDFRNGRAGAAGDSTVALEAHAGAGVEVTLGPLSLIADLRYCLVEAASPDAVSSALGHDYDPGGWFASIAAGISF